MLHVPNPKFSTGTGMVSGKTADCGAAGAYRDLVL
jgi:hypothetical protein